MKLTKQKPEPLEDHHLWGMAWMLIIIGVFLGGMAFALGDFSPLVYRTVVAFSLSSFVSGFAFFATLGARIDKRNNS